MNKKLLVSLSFLLILCCRGPNEPIPFRASQFTPLRISGIVNTDANGNVIRYIGNPEISMIDHVNIDRIYPNPTTNFITHSFELLDDAELAVFVVKGFGDSERVDEDVEHYIGNFLVSTPYGLGQEIYRDHFEMGYQNIYIYLQDYLSDEGFYRLYFQITYQNYEVVKSIDLVFMPEVSCESITRLGLLSYYEHLCD